MVEKKLLNALHGDILVCYANQQIGKTFYDFNFKYDTDWCLYFVNTCFNNTFDPSGFNRSEISCSKQIEYIAKKGKFISVMTLSELRNAGLGSTPAFNAIKNYNNKINTSYVPEKGDIFFLVNNPNNTYIAKHVGIVESVSSKNGYKLITTIEGNINGDLNSSQPYFKTSEVNKVQYVFYNGNYFKLNYWKNGTPIIQQDRQILGFYPTSLYN